MRIAIDLQSILINTLASIGPGRRIHGKFAEFLTRRKAAGHPLTNQCDFNFKTGPETKHQPWFGDGRFGKLLENKKHGRR